MPAKVIADNVMYEFNHDWFSDKIPIFEKHLSHLRERPSAALEIGTYEGRSAVWLLDNILTHEDSRLLCVDIREQPNLRSNLLHSSGRHKVKVVIGKSGRVLRKLNLAQFDFIYVDGNHGQVEVLEDAVLSFRLAKAGAVICFDDYLWDDPQFNQHGTPRISLDAFLKIYERKISVLELGYQVWIRKLHD